MARAKKKREMTAATLSRLPLTAGGALAGSLARGGLRMLAILIDAGYWALGRFMRAPVAISCTAAVAGFSLLAGGNALFLQTDRHPAPLFFAPPAHDRALAAIRPVVPAVRPRLQPAAAEAIDNETTGSVPARGSIDNADVRQLQQKLGALGLYNGTVDGLFGRRTAAAIKAFEMKAGLKPSGKLTRHILALIEAAPLPAAHSLPAAEPRPAPAVTVASAKPAATPPMAAVVELAPAPAAQQPGPQQAVAPQPAAVAAAVAAHAPGKPVPLAPVRRTVQTVPVIVAPMTDPDESLDGNALQSQPAGQGSAPAAAPALARANAHPAQPAAAQPASAGNEIADAAAAAPTDIGSTLAQVQEITQPAPAASAPVADAGVSDSVLAQNGTVGAPLRQASTPPAADPATAVAALGPDATPAQRLAAQMGTLPPEATPPNTAMPVSAADPGDATGSTDPVLITKIQRGLASLGFLGQKIDGVPGEGTAKAIRNFQVFYDYKVTGLATPELLNLLIQHGATI
jgi:peptidoglycan hydrolase-like protein with peptidoglycan-binding domain